MAKARFKQYSTLFHIQKALRASLCLPEWNSTTIHEFHFISDSIIGKTLSTLACKVVESLGHDKNTITSGLEQVLWQATCVVEKGKNEPSFRLHREQKLKGKKIHGSSVIAISTSCTLFCTNFEVRAIHHGCPQHGHVEHGLLDKYKTLGWDGTLNSMAIMGTQLWPEPQRLVEVLFRATDSLLEQSNYSPKNRGVENTKPTIPILQIKHLLQVPRLIQLGRNFLLIKGTTCVSTKHSPTHRALPA
ncbi:hypothetical protein DFH07DRAFT_1005197 [Mycena maculata]|uniref:Uncharacterized protein n=1 Tax=Mycena maculata TaxID=230809 RepID=A0AAD7MM84_9AGAR|nr:hypothetical protein DFH07DRAFT_1005197 [Mycena maculata]